MAKKYSSITSEEEFKREFTNWTQDNNTHSIFERVDGTSENVIVLPGDLQKIESGRYYKFLSRAGRVDRIEDIMGVPVLYKKKGSAIKFYLHHPSVFRSEFLKYAQENELLKEVADANGNTEKVLILNPKQKPIPGTFRKPLSKLGGAKALEGLLGIKVLMRGTSSTTGRFYLTHPGVFREEFLKKMTELGFVKHYEDTNGEIHSVVELPESLTRLKLHEFANVLKFHSTRNLDELIGMPVLITTHGHRTKGNFYLDHPAVLRSKFLEEVNRLGFLKITPEGTKVELPRNIQSIPQLRKFIYKLREKYGGTGVQHMHVLLGLPVSILGKTLTPTFRPAAKGGEVVDYSTQAAAISRAVTFESEDLKEHARTKLALHVPRRLTFRQLLALMRPEEKVSVYIHNSRYLVRTAQLALMQKLQKDEILTGKKVASFYSGASELHEVNNALKAGFKITDVEPCKELHSLGQSASKVHSLPQLVDLRENVDAVEIYGFSRHSSLASVALDLLSARRNLKEGGVLILHQDHAVHPGMSQVLENAGFTLRAVYKPKLGFEVDKSAKDVLDSSRFIVAIANKPARGVKVENLVEIAANKGSISSHLAALGEAAREVGKRETDVEVVAAVENLHAAVEKMPVSEAKAQMPVMFGIVKAVTLPIGGIGPTKLTTLKHLDQVAKDAEAAKGRDETINQYLNSVVKVARAVKAKLVG